MIAFRTATCCVGITLALCVGIGVAKASPAPDRAESDCSWAEHGTSMTIGEVTYRCLCAQLTATDGHKVIACRWYASEALPKALRAKKLPAKKAKPKVRVYPKPSVVA